MEIIHAGVYGHLDDLQVKMNAIGNDLLHDVFARGRQSSAAPSPGER
jgi:hypothetical protein